jgi:hypothetical protein
MGRDSRRNNFHEQRELFVMGFAVTILSTKKSFYTYIRKSHCLHRSQPCGHLDGAQFLAMFVVAFNE